MACSNDGETVKTSEYCAIGLLSGKLWAAACEKADSGAVVWTLGWGHSIYGTPITLQWRRAL